MMRDRVGYKRQVTLLCDLLHHLGLTDSGRSHQKDRPLTDLGNTVEPILISGQICPDCINDLLFCSKYVHNDTFFVRGMFTSL